MKKIALGLTVIDVNRIDGRHFRAVINDDAERKHTISDRQMQFLLDALQATSESGAPTSAPCRAAARLAAFLLRAQSTDRSDGVLIPDRKDACAPLIGDHAAVSRPGLKDADRTAERSSSPSATYSVFHWLSRIPMVKGSAGGRKAACVNS